LKVPTAAYSAVLRVDPTLNEEVLVEMMPVLLSCVTSRLEPKEEDVRLALDEDIIDKLESPFEELGLETRDDDEETTEERYSIDRTGA